MEKALLDFIAACQANASHGQMTLERLGPDTYPDPAKTSWNDKVDWRVSITFGHGYFSGAVVRWVGTWAVPHRPKEGDPPGYEGYRYNERQLDMPVELAVKAFLSAMPPAWALLSPPE